MAFPFGVAGVGIGLATGILGGKKAARGARRLAGAENAIRALQLARQRAAQIREAGQALGEQAVAVGGSGVESSSAITGRSSLLNQLSSNLNFLNAQDRLGQKAAAAQSLINRGSKIADFGSQFGGFVGAFQGTSLSDFGI